MALLVSVNEYKPSANQQKISKKLPSKWGMTVSGNYQDFTKQVKEVLALNGFYLHKGVTDKILWKLDATVCPPPLYIYDLLKAISGPRNVRPGKNLQNMIDTALGRVNGQADFFGIAAEGHPAGQGEIKIGVIGDTFIASCNEDDRARARYLEGAGWMPLNLITGNPGHERIRAVYGDRPWVTRLAVMAAHLGPLMNSKTADQYRILRAEQVQILKDSKNTGLPNDDFRIPQSPLAAEEGKSPMDFQHSGVGNALKSHRKKRRGAIIGDDMGLGKTIQLAGYLSVAPRVDNVLIFCKSNMKLKMKDEIELWTTRPEGIPPITILSGRDGVIDTEKPGIVILNYDIADAYSEQLKKVKWDIIGCDEAHTISNMEANRTKAILGDVDGAEGIPLADDGFLILMTGTLPNRIERLWRLASAVRPDIYGRDKADFQRFMNRYCPAELIAKRVPKAGHENAKELTDKNSYVRHIPLPGKPQRLTELYYGLRMSGMLTARLKSDMENLLPPKMRAVVKLPVEMTKEELAELRNIDTDLEELVERVADRAALRGLEAKKGTPEYASAIINVIAGIPKDSPEFHEISRLQARMAYIKAPYIADIIIENMEADMDLDPEQRRKFVIYDRFQESGKLIMEKINNAFPGGACLYNGSITSDAKRKAMIDKFQGGRQNAEKALEKELSKRRKSPADLPEEERETRIQQIMRSQDNMRVFVMSDSGLTGATLTRSYMMYVNTMSWNPEDMSQGEDRIHRIGQGMPVLINYCMVEGSYDHHVGMTNIRKMNRTREMYHTPNLSGDSIRDREKALAESGLNLQDM